MTARRALALMVLAVGAALAVLGTRMDGWASLAVLVVGLGLVVDVLVQAIQPGPVAVPVRVDDRRPD